MTSPAQPAGWYADPSGLPATRWWDGRQWTEHLQPGPAVLPPTAGLGGYFPQAAPSGPLVPGAHTVVPTDPDAAEIFAVQSTGAAGAAFPATRTATASGGGLPAPAAEQIDYAIPPVDGGTSPASMFLTNDHPALSPADALSAFGSSPADPDRRPTARHAAGLLTHPLLLSTLAVVILAALVVYALLLR
ncbi:DUF2510 domain-containing protein [Actinoplanes sp. L3-i22]|uniref:DUF2510 domain-containing protein n=1 Tax=Actinoplanes sp. L3-i22 TaxID=2836373 RepID=UPI001C76A13F|nr:DUF2510 domain-containing protein [Actinoplanes sp. L3-i22]BCY07442.1 hypothetical protein L3i22_025300 [Actinoplanes sp. L3-i22]